jgi:hypothetical protein
MLKHMLEALPKEERIAFLHEVVNTLDQDQKQALRKLLENGETTFQPTRAPAPVAAPSKPQTEAERQALVEAAFQRISSEHQEKTSIGKELYSCLGLGLLGVVAVVFLIVGGAELFEWLKGMVGGS